MPANWREKFIKDLSLRGIFPVWKNLLRVGTTTPHHTSGCPSSIKTGRSDICTIEGLPCGTLCGPAVQMMAQLLDGEAPPAASDEAFEYDGEHFFVG
jgi:hypothetical protein